MAWLVFYPTEDDPLTHVAPDFGREHELNTGCWCHPEQDTEVETVLVHNQEH